MAFLRRHLIFLFLLAAVLDVAGKSEKRTFTVIGSDDQSWKNFGYLSGSTFTPLTPKRHVRSPAFPAPAGAEINFCRRATDLVTGKPVYSPLVSGHWPEGASTALFVLISPGPNHPDYQAIAINDDLDRFPSESLLVVNATTATFESQIGKERLTIQPGVSKPVSTTAYIPAQDLDDIPDPGLPFGLAVNLSRNLQPVYATPILVNHRTRILLLVLPPRNAGSSRIVVRTIRQTLPAPEDPSLSTPLALPPPSDAATSSVGESRVSTP